VDKRLTVIVLTNLPGGDPAGLAHRVAGITERELRPEVR
jgi:hypothetical protein